MNHKSRIYGHHLINKMIKSKKASVQISFSWIFMIIVGTFFIMLAYNIIGKYQENENLKSDLILDQTLRTILNNAGRTAGIEENTLIPLRDQQTRKSIFQNKKVEITCPASELLFVINGEEKKNNFLKNYPTFMTYIDEKDVGYSNLAVESFKMPFKITNLLAIVSEKNLIIFDGESKITEKLKYKFDKGSYRDLNFRIIDFSNLYLSSLNDEIKKNSYSSIVFVSDKGKSLNDITLDSFDIYTSHVQIEEGNEDGNYGEIQLEDKLGSKNYGYIDLDNSLSIITMAIFSKRETFDCSYDLLVKSISPVYSFYINKSSYFEDLTMEKDVCSSISSRSQQKIKYQILKNSLIDIKDKIEEDQKINKDENLNVLLGEVNMNLLDLEDSNCQYIY